MKKHPLEDVIEGLQENSNLKFVDDDENINGLVLASDIVVTYTSGTGLLGLLANKRVITVGKAFYSQDGLAKNADSSDEIKEIIETYPTLLEDEIEKISRFIYYLLNRYYSFGDFKTREVKFENGKRITATTYISLYQLICFGQKYLYHKKDRALIDFSSGLFDRYRFSQQNLPRGSVVKTDDNEKAKICPSANSSGALVVENDLKNNGALTLKEKRMKKLKENPYRYFSESKWAILRVIAPIFKK